MPRILIILFLFPILASAQELVSEEADTLVSDTSKDFSADTVETIGYSSF